MGPISFESAYRVARYSSLKACIQLSISALFESQGNLVKKLLCLIRPSSTCAPESPSNPCPIIQSHGLLLYLKDEEGKVIGEKRKLSGSPLAFTQISPEAAERKAECKNGARSPSTSATACFGQKGDVQAACACNRYLWTHFESLLRSQRTFPKDPHPDTSLAKFLDSCSDAKFRCAQTFNKNDSHSGAKRTRFELGRLVPGQLRRDRAVTVDQHLLQVVIQVSILACQE